MATGRLADRLRETLALFDQRGVPLTTTEVANSLDVGRRSTYERLETLVEQERLETKKVGANARVWWRRANDPGGKTPDRSAGDESLVDAALDGAAVGVVVLNEHFEVAWINDVTEQYFELDRDAVLGWDSRTLVDERIAPLVEKPDIFAEAVMATYDDNSYTERFECRVTGGDSRAPLWLEHNSYPIESGAFAGGRVELYHDITDRERSEQSRREGRHEFESLVNAVEEYAIFTLDADGHVRTWNPGAERIKGYEADEILGEHVSTFYTEADREAGVPEQNLAAAAEEGSVEDEGWRICADGERFWANVTLTAIRDNDGEIDGFAKVTRDMTDRRERERDLRRERNLFEQVLETSPTAIGVFEADGTARRVNRQFTELLGRGSDGGSEYSLGEQPLLDENGDVIPYDERPAPRALSTGETVTDQRIRVEGPDRVPRWLSVNATPLDGQIEGVVITMSDVTRLTEQAERLTRQRDDIRNELDKMFERIDDAFFALDEEWRFTYVNDRATEVLDRSAEALTGRTIWEAFPGTVGSQFQEQYERAMETQESVTFEEYYEPLDTWFEVSAYPADDGLSVYFRDMTDRKARERKLEEYRQRYQTLVENFPGGAVALVDEDLRYSTFGGRPEGETDLTRDDIEGEPVREVLPGKLAEVVAPRYEAALDGEPSEFAETVDGRVYQFQFVPVRDEDGEVFAATATSRDITDRRERERNLRDRVRQQEVVTKLGQRALEDRNLDTLLAEAAELVAETLDNDYCKVLELDAEAGELLLRQGVGWRDGIVGDAVVSASENGSQAAHTLATEGSVVVEDLTTETRFSGPDLLRNHDVRSGISTIIGPFEEPWGILGTHDTDRKEFSENDATFVQAVANILASAIDRHRYEQELIRQREQVAALNNLNEVVREITAAVIDQSTREEIEQTVCERLAGTDSYLFAWTGEVDPAFQTVRLRTEAGVENYLDGVTISVDPDDERSEGPTGRALKTGETQVCHDIEVESQHDPWRSHVEQYGFRSSAAIPITHEGTIYGVLNVYADRPYAFRGEEGAVISQLGEVVGHAIAAAERKQALLSDELVELDFEIRDLFAARDARTETSGTITFDHVVSAQDGTFLVYGTAATDALDTVRALVDAVPHWESLTIISEDEPVRFELRMVDPPVLSVVASHGGYIDEACIEGGDYRMTIHLAPTNDVRQVTTAVEEAYPNAELLRRRQITRQTDEEPLHQQLIADLTERQWASLEAAYHAGFFEWPRDSSGEEMADSLGIAPPTFHQHLRTAERKVFDAVFASSVHSVV